MSVALTGFLTGFAKAGKERIDKEREDEEALISNRLKMAAANKIKREKETDAQKALLTGRYEKVLPYAAGLSEQQKLALVSNDEIATQFYNRASKGETVDVDRLLKINEEKIPQNFTTVKSYIAQISAAPAPVDSKTIDSLTDTEGFFGARLMTPGRLQKTAQQFGGSAEELLAYENASAVAEMPQVAALNVDALRQPKSSKERIEEAEIKALDLMEQFGDNSPEAISAIANHAVEKARAEMLNPNQERYTKMLDEARVNFVLANRSGDPEKIKQAKQELDSVELATRREVTDKTSPSDIRRNFKDVSMNALSMLYPRLKENLVAVRDPNTQQIIDYQVATTNPEIAAQVQNTRLAAMSRMYYRFYANEDGTPYNRAVAETLTASGVEFDDMGRPIFEVAVPAPAPDPNRPSRIDPNAATPAAARTTPAPSAAASGQTASGKITQAPPAAAGDTYRFENLNPSQVKAVVEASGTGEGLNADGVRRLLTNKDDFNAQPLEQRKRWFAAMNKLAPSSAPANAPNFRSVEEAEAANLPKGTRITINGRRAEVQ
jgi:hypothetical protein